MTTAVCLSSPSVESVESVVQKDMDMERVMGTLTPGAGEASDGGPWDPTQQIQCISPRPDANGNNRRRNRFTPLGQQILVYIVIWPL